MNKWQMDGNSIDRWPAGGGTVLCSPAGKKHSSIHPKGREDEYRQRNRVKRGRG